MRFVDDVRELAARLDRATRGIGVGALGDQRAVQTLVAALHLFGLRALVIALVEVKRGVGRHQRVDEPCVIQMQVGEEERDAVEVHVQLFERGGKVGASLFGRRTGVDHQRLALVDHRIAVGRVQLVVAERNLDQVDIGIGMYADVMHAARIFLCSCRFQENLTACGGKTDCLRGKPHRIDR